MTVSQLSPGSHQFEKIVHQRTAFSRDSIYEWLIGSCEDDNTTNLIFSTIFPRTFISNAKMSEASSKKKRKYVDGGSGKNTWRKWGAINRRPKRGAPGMLLTCETGREKKCQREGLEILNFYLQTSDLTITPGNRSSQKEDDRVTGLSLEEELERLKSKKESPEPSAFGVYDTSCRGAVFVLCTLPTCNLIPTIQTEYMLSKKNQIKSKNDEAGDDVDNVSNMKLKSDRDGAETDEKCDSPTMSPAKDEKNDDGALSVKETPPWDPISTFQTILSDINNDSNKAAPRSRFVTRMIPIQATCFASPEELELTCLEVLKKYVSRTAKTFAIVFKRRNCSNLNRNLVIKIVGEIMSKKFPACKVRLDKPDTTILIEVCGTLCGLSVVENVQDCRKFNLIGATGAEVR